MDASHTSACVVGLGYIGLPTAALMASRGLDVIGVDIDPSVVETVGQGRIHITEADLDGLVQKVVRSGKFVARSAPERADVFLIAVPTPLSAHKKPLVDHVFDAARSIAPQLASGTLVIIESTCPIGTTEKICNLLAALRPDLTFPTQITPGEEPDVAVAYCPERVLPGRILAELEHNDRCIGGVTRSCAMRARRFYELFVRGVCIETSAVVAETVKLAENAFRDTNIAFANELSMVCDRLKVDVWDVIALANRHPRVNILNPGPGVGGHCIAVDPWFIVDSAPREARLIRMARQVNDRKARYVIERVRKLIRSHPECTVACLGLTFKANVDDLRESPALEIATELVREFGEKIGVVDPFVHVLPEELVRLGAKRFPLDEALAQSGIVIVLVDHDVFRRVRPEQWSRSIVYDTRGIWRVTPNAVVTSAEFRRQPIVSDETDQRIDAVAALRNGRPQ